VEAIELAVEGEMPQWLAGKLFRSGPGTLEVETELGFNYLVNHWFDGLTVRLISISVVFFTLRLTTSHARVLVPLAAPSLLCMIR
jgi:hypothetical protein